MKPCKICNKPQSGGYIICAECAVEVNRMQAEIQQFREAAAEYGIDAQTMLTLARSQLATAKENAELREAQRWISVEERLPEHNQDVIAITKAGNLSVGQNIVTCTFCKPRNEKQGLFYLPYTMGRNLIVTHWQPLPQPPQKG